MLEALELDRAALAKIDAQVRILKIVAQISPLPDSITELIATGEAAQQRLDSYKYPVLTLPNEIVAEIFLHFLPPYPDVDVFGKSTPTRLTHICRQWRDVALSTPALWRAIRPCRARAMFSLGWDEVFSLTTAFLERSGSLPLSVHASDAYKPSPFVPSIILHRDRWEHITFCLEAPTLSNALDGPMPLLRTMWLRPQGGSSRQPIAVPSDNVPLLRSVTLDDRGARIVRLPWSQLTSLKLSDHVSLTPCVSILRQTTCLTNLALCLSDTWYDGDDPRDTYPDLILPHLENLAFEPRSDMHQGFFQSLVAPALLWLELPEMFFGVSRSDRIQVGLLNSFILKSGCKLDGIRITEASFPEIYRDALPSVPQVISLARVSRPLTVPLRIVR
ncbi:F-box domain-containing protein [Favolaschia claudopus]|uniref:F-box domain-containing protein n=1 Tax=Favolaschia claudopus TaxID=2862362 RepID=A0AAW0DLS0_9AGAR